MSGRRGRRVLGTGDDARSVGAEGLPLFVAPQRAPPPWRQTAALVHPPLARARDPETSHAAAAAYTDEAATQNGQLDAYYVGCGVGGATFWEAARDLGWTPEQVARRLAGLREAGLLVTLRERRHGDGHRPSHVWVHAQHAGAYRIEALLPAAPRKQKAA